MLMSDIINDPAFSVVERTNAINVKPYKAHEISDWLPWDVAGISTLTATIENKNGKLGLVPEQPVGGPALEITLNNRTMRSIELSHYPTKVTVRGSEVQGVRKFDGSINELETAQERVNEKETTARDYLDLQLEYGRAAAISGLIRYSDGSTKRELHNLFEVARNTYDIDFTDSSLDLNEELTTAKEQGLVELGDFAVEGWVHICTPPVFKSVSTHASVKEGFKYFNTAFATADKSKGFTLSDDITLRKYWRGNSNGVNFLTPGDSFLCPIIRGGFYLTKFGPAEISPNSLGIPIYVNPYLSQDKTTIIEDIESNHVNWVAVPRGIVRIRQKA